MDWLKRKSHCFLILILLLILPLLIRGEYHIHILTLILFYAYLATCWDIVGGIANQMSMGHAAFLGIGAYASTILYAQWGTSPWLGMLVGGIVAVIGSIVIGFPCFRLLGVYFALATLAFAEVLRLFIRGTMDLWGLHFKGAQGIGMVFRGHDPWMFQFEGKIYYYYIILAMLFVIIGISFAIKNSKLGLYLTAIGQNQDAAEASGVNVTQCKLMALMVSALFTAFGGTFYAQFNSYIHPDRIIGADISVEMLFIAVIGGMGTIYGPTLGAFLLTPLREIPPVLMGSKYVGAHLIVCGLILIIVVMFIPRGIFPTFADRFFRPKGNNQKEKLGGTHGEIAR
jgi:branched-chain amino acid transport system permease protein